MIDFRPIPMCAGNADFIFPRVQDASSQHREGSGDGHKSPRNER